MFKNNFPVVITAAAFATVAFVSCSLFEGTRGKKEKPSGPAFPHAIHVVENEMGCADCHPGAKKEARAGMPTLASCLECHEEQEAGTPLAALITELKGREAAKAPLWGEAAEGELKFDHSKHGAIQYELTSGQKKALDCSDCHRGVGQSKGAVEDARPPMELCTDCHDKGRPAAEEGKDKGPDLEACSTCHKVYRKDVKPADHGGLWHQGHGVETKFGEDKAEARRCAYCHEENYCIACHQIESPRSHTQYFRLRGHGLDASLSRERCTVCHFEDYCVRCHQGTRPISHTSSWSQAPYRHCSTCHFPLSGEAQCFTCHKTTTHTGAPLYPRDSNHTGGCTMVCHTNPHADPGPSCTLCHK